MDVANLLGRPGVGGGKARPENGEGHETARERDMKVQGKFMPQLRRQGACRRSCRPCHDETVDASAMWGSMRRPDEGGDCRGEGRFESPFFSADGG